MAFHFTEAQWESIGLCIQRIGGVPADWIKDKLEVHIDRIFVCKNVEKQKADLFRRVYAAAYELSDALGQLAEIGKLEANRDELLRDMILHNDVYERLKFAMKVQKYADGADWMLDKGLKIDNEPVRGRPADTELLKFVKNVLNIARSEQWNLENDRGHTSAAFMNFLVQLASCARSAGLDHSRDIRRALTRAVATAREEDTAKLRERHLADTALDAIALSAQNKAGA